MILMNCPQALLWACPANLKISLACSIFFQSKKLFWGHTYTFWNSALDLNANRWWPFSFFPEIDQASPDFTCNQNLPESAQHNGKWLDFYLLRSENWLKLSTGFNSNCAFSIFRSIRSFYLKTIIETVELWLGMLKNWDKIQIELRRIRVKSSQNWDKTKWLLDFKKGKSLKRI